MEKLTDGSIFIYFYNPFKERFVGGVLPKNQIAYHSDEDIYETLPPMYPIQLSPDEILFQDRFPRTVNSLDLYNPDNNGLQYVKQSYLFEERSLN